MIPPQDSPAPGSTPNPAEKVLLIAQCESHHLGAFFARALAAGDRPYKIVDESPFLQPLQTSIVHKIAFRLLGRRPLTFIALNRAIERQSKALLPQVVVITGGSFITPRTLDRLKARGARIVNFLTDDPWNNTNANRRLLASLPHFDLCFSSKRAIMNDLLALGCKRVIFLPFGYDPAVHFPEAPDNDDERREFSCDVLFAGNADKDRAPIVEELVGVPDLTVVLRGGYWERFPRLRAYRKNFAYGRGYRLAISQAKICLCLVRRANRDGHVMRTFEIPACGGFMLAERTEEHLELFEEDKEAVYFGDTGEMLAKVKFYLQRPELRSAIARAGYMRAVQSRYTYADRMSRMLSAVSPANVEGDLS